MDIVLRFSFLSINFFCPIRIPVHTHTGRFTIKRLENPLHSEWIRTSHTMIQPRSLGLWQGPVTKKQQPVLLYWGPALVLANLWEWAWLPCACWRVLKRCCSCKSIRNSNSIMKLSYNAGICFNKKHRVHCTTLTMIELLSRGSLKPLISLNLVSTKLYCFEARVHCYHCLNIIFSNNPVRRSKELPGDPHLVLHLIRSHNRGQRPGRKKGRPTYKRPWRP